MIYYAGIGARKTPNKVLQRMTLYGKILADLGFILRSGGATGADTAFERGCNIAGGSKQIYLPWRGYNNNSSPYFHVSDAALDIAREIYGPRWKRMKPSVHKLMARNIYQILGQALDNPSSFVVCWTVDGAKTESERTRLTGGTGQAIACASRYNIPVFNLQIEGEETNLKDFIGELYHDDI